MKPINSEKVYVNTKYRKDWADWFAMAQQKSLEIISVVPVTPPLSIISSFMHLKCIHSWGLGGLVPNSLHGEKDGL